MPDRGCLTRERWQALHLTTPPNRLAEQPPNRCRLCFQQAPECGWEATAVQPVRLPEPPPPGPPLPWPRRLQLLRLRAFYSRRAFQVSGQRQSNLLVPRRET